MDAGPGFSVAPMRDSSIGIGNAVRADCGRVQLYPGELRQEEQTAPPVCLCGRASGAAKVAPPQLDEGTGGGFLDSARYPHRIFPSLS